jgi:hypothetical protein
MTAAGFPHSGISGSTPTCGSPKLIAAYRALPRLSVPRHPPCALIRLTGYALPPEGTDGVIPVHRDNTHVLVLSSLRPPGTTPLGTAPGFSTQPITRVFKPDNPVRECTTNARPVRTFRSRRSLLVAPERR